MTAERSESETVAWEVTDGIAWVRFNRPEKRNCMSPKLNRQMLTVLPKPWLPFVGDSRRRHSDKWTNLQTWLPFTCPSF